MSNKAYILKIAGQLADEHRAGQFTAKGINLESGISMPTVYKFLSVLEAEREIVCENPDRERGRIYRIPTSSDVKDFKVKDENRKARESVEAVFREYGGADSVRPVFEDWRVAEVIISEIEASFPEAQRNELKAKIQKLLK